MATRGKVAQVTATQGEVEPTICCDIRGYHSVVLAGRHLLTFRSDLVRSSSGSISLDTEEKAQLGQIFTNRQDITSQKTC